MDWRVTTHPFLSDREWIAFSYQPSRPGFNRTHTLVGPFRNHKSNRVSGSAPKREVVGYRIELYSEIHVFDMATVGDLDLNGRKI